MAEMPQYVQADWEVKYSCASFLNTAYSLNSLNSVYVILYIQTVHGSEVKGDGEGAAVLRGGAK